MDLKDVSIVIPGECYQRLISHLTNHFTYAQIFQVIKDLEVNAFQVESNIVAPYDPKLQTQGPIFPLVNGLEDARQIDQEEMHRSESTDNNELATDDRSQLD